MPTKNPNKDECCAVAHEAGYKLRQVVDSVTDEAHDVRENVTKVTEDVIKTVRDKPIQASMVAAGVGFLLGLLFRRR